MRTQKTFHFMDRASGTLDVQLLSSAVSGTFTISSLSQLGSQSWDAAAGDYIELTIDNERIVCSAMEETGGTVTLTIAERGADDTTPATHTAGSTVYLNMVKAHLDEIQAEVKFQRGALDSAMIETTPTTITDANTHTIAGDKTADFVPGRAFLFKIGSTWYRAIVRSATYSSPNTTIELTGDGLPASGTIATAGFELSSSSKMPAGLALLDELAAVPAENPPSGYRWIFPTSNGIGLKDSSGNVTYLGTAYKTAASSSNTLTIDGSLGNFFDVELTENITTLTMQNFADGQACTIRIKQHASAAKTVAVPASWRFNSLIASWTMTATVGKTDLIGLRYNAGASKYDVVALVQGA